MSLPTSTREFYYPKFGSYTDLKLRESTLPSELKSSQVLVKIHAVSLQFRDLMISHGQYSAPTPEYLVPCSDMAGDVIAIGSEVSEWKTGDRVCANLLPDHLYGDPSPQSVSAALGGGVNGVLTQCKIFKSTVLVAIPEHLSYEEASTLPCAALTAYNALHGPIPIRGGDTILVQGTGGVSIFALQFAVVCGATVILTSSSDEKLELGKKYGAKHTINYKKIPDWEKEVMKITKGRGVDHTIEVGGPGTFAKSMQSTRFGGWIHIIGVLAMETSSTNFIISAIWRGLNFRGIQVGSVELFMNRLIETHPDVTRPVVDKVFSFENSIKAFEYLESQVHVGKVVIKVA
ncbi:hypothetical protein Moror_14507 [Moniliophthora roreri MCA 2997]|uniref:Enoyl reductase (ER) domain-containing protein n=1 Tax=Moniliophthora roreri (strain MCA 2997) TaxID=1381753 RepID=V2XKC8_MONRO|nr:hypothetical protein Moror_14507 [Moniliophthora roreri MCA 2997]